MQSPLEEKDADEYLETDINGIKKKAKSQIKKFIFKIIVLVFTLIASSIYYLFFRTSILSETISYINPISFSFIELLVFLPDNIDIEFHIYYFKNNSRIQAYCQKGKKFYNVKSELNVSSLKLEKEKEDFLYFAFRTNEKNNLMLLYKYITIMNKIYNLNSQNEVEPAFRDKSFHLYNEKILSKKNEYTKTYSYNVHSHSIKIFDNQYDFPVIDDSEMVRYRPWNIKGEYYDFLIELKKQEHFNLIEIKSDSFWKIFFWLFGSIAAIIDIIIPLFKSLWQKGRLCKKNRGSNDMNLNLTKNEIVQQNENIELPEINNNN